MKTIELSRGLVALVDDADFEALNRHKWSALKACRTWYAVRESETGFAYMHRVIAVTPKGVKTDHMDGNGLNNQRANLRVCTNGQNSRNQTRKRTGREFTSRFRGVSLHRATGKWLAQIGGHGAHKYLGLFACEIAAAGAYDAAGISRDPEFFTPNFSASWLAP